MTHQHNGLQKPNLEKILSKEKPRLNYIMVKEISAKYTQGMSVVTIKMEKLILYFIQNHQSFIIQETTQHWNIKLMWSKYSHWLLKISQSEQKKGINYKDM